MEKLLFCIGPSPRCYFFVFNPFLYAQLAINEFNCKRGFTDENGEDVDWIEIYNPTSDSIFLGNYYLSDKLNNLDKWQFPNYYIQPQEIDIVCASGNENTKFPHHWESLVKADNIWKYRIGNTAPPTIGTALLETIKTGMLDKVELDMGITMTILSLPQLHRYF